MQTDLAIGPAGDVWVMNNWQDIDSCFGVPDEALSTRCGGRCHDLFRDGETGALAANRAGTLPHRQVRGVLSSQQNGAADGRSGQTRNGSV
jgi:hypothetical protein